MIKKLLLITSLLFCALGANAAYLPVAVTGYNADVVANGAGPATGSITLDFDGAGYALMASTFNPSASIFPTQYLPNGGVVNSAATAGVTYNLASYSANNSLRITGLTTDSLIFPTGISASEVYILAATGSGSSTVDMVVNFTDGTNQSVTNTVADWYSGTNYAILGLGRTNVTTTLNGIDNNTTNPRLYEYKIVLTAANSSKVIRSVKFTRTLVAAGVLNVMGITINSPAAPSCLATPTAPANAGSVCAGNVTLSWPAAGGASGYDVFLDAGATATTQVATNQVGTTYTATGLTAGPYAWKIIPKNVNGSATGCATFTFTVNAGVTPGVTVAAVPAGSICAGTSVTFTATPVNGGTTPTYQWKKGTTNVGTNAATYTDAGLANGDAITVVMTSNAVCPSPATATSAAITMTVLPRPAPSITPASDTTFCAGGSVVLNAPTGTGLTYQWLLNNAIIPTATTASYTANASGLYRVLVSNGFCADTSAAKTVTVKPLPSAAVTPAGPLVICQNSFATLSAPATAGYTYQWMQGSTALVGAVNATYNASAAGSYSVVVSSLGCTSTSTAVAITVNPSPGATATAAGTLNFCQGGSVTLNAGSTATGITYQWLQNNLVIAGATNASYNATTSGAYRVRIVKTSTGCADTSLPAINVNVSAATSNVVTQSVASPICQGANILFQSQNPNTYTYQWYRNTVAIPGATNFFYSANTAGAYHVTVVNGACTSTSVDRTVVVNPLPVATATATGATAFCDGGLVRLDGNVVAGNTYQWRRNGSPIAGATGTFYNAMLSGSYSLTVTSSLNCSATSTPLINVVVSTMPSAVVTTVGTPTFCQGNALTLNATAGTGYTYQWLNNTVTIPGANASTYSATTSGDYSVTITNGTCVTTSPSFKVDVTPAPPAVITPAGATSFCQGGSVTMNANRGAGLTYQWTLNGGPIPGATTYQYTAVNAGSYGVDMFDGTCPATSTPVAVVVNRFPVAIITVTGGNQMGTDPYSSYQWYRNGVAIAGATAQNYTAIQNGFYTVVVSDNLGCTATSGVQNITSLDINGVQGNAGIVKLYPNPSDGMVMVEADAMTDLNVMSVDGRELITAKATKRIDIGSLPQGLYLIRIVNHTTGQLMSLQKILRK